MIVTDVLATVVDVVRFREFGVNVQAASAGNPEQENVTVPLKPSTGDAVMPRFVVVPGVTNAPVTPELLEITKSGEATRAVLVELT